MDAEGGWGDAPAMMGLQFHTEPSRGTGPERGWEAGSRALRAGSLTTYLIFPYKAKESNNSAGKRINTNRWWAHN